MATPAPGSATPLIMVVDDEPDVRDVLEEILVQQGFTVISAEDGAAALERFARERPALVFLDLEMPRLGGMKALPELRRLDPAVAVVIVTAYGDTRAVVEAMRLGAYDYLTKPFVPEDIVQTARRALERWRLLARVGQLESRLAADHPLRHQMGTSAAIGRVIEQVTQVAASAFSVLVQGETGTGKELVARAIHRESPRRDRAFVALDCGAIPETLIESELFGFERGAFTGADRRTEGHFELAEGGTLFLDEVVNLPLTTQAKLLRALQERQVQRLGGRQPLPVDVRIIAASNLALEDEIRAGRFRADLFYRLNEFRIVLPALRDRPEDVPALARRFLDEAAVELRRPAGAISEAALELLGRQRWPGNVRELRNAIRQAVLRSGGVILPEHLPAEGAAGEPAGAPGASLVGQRSLREIASLAAAGAERLAIRQALSAAGGNKSEAARMLRTDYKTLHLKMKALGIPARPGGEPER